MMTKLRLLALVHAVALAVWSGIPVEEWGLQRLEEALQSLDRDDVDDGSPYVPARRRDALKEFEWFLKGSGWTTNQFVEALFYEMTNGYERGWRALSEDQLEIRGGAAWKLGEINLPIVTNFFRTCNENPAMWCRMTSYCGMVTYTNLEPEVLDYMRTLSVQTNTYDEVASCVYYGMLDVVRYMDDALKPAATNRLAKYAYGTLRQLTRFQAAQDDELIRLIPAYSNSVQRLAVMREIAHTTSNNYMRAEAPRVVQELSAVPVDELNNLTWLVEE